MVLCAVECLKVLLTNEVKNINFAAALK